MTAEDTNKACLGADIFMKTPFASGLKVVFILHCFDLLKVKGGL